MGMKPGSTIEDHGEHYGEYTLVIRGKDGIKRVIRGAKAEPLYFSSTTKLIVRRYLVGSSYPRFQ